MKHTFAGCEISLWLDFIWLSSQPVHKRVEIITWQQWAAALFNASSSALINKRSSRCCTERHYRHFPTKTKHSSLFVLAACSCAAIPAGLTSEQENASRVFGPLRCNMVKMWWKKQKRCTTDTMVEIIWPTIVFGLQDTERKWNKNNNFLWIWVMSHVHLLVQDYIPAVDMNNSFHKALSQLDLKKWANIKAQPRVRKGAVCKTSTRWGEWIGKGFPLGLPLCKSVFIKYSELDFGSFPVDK